MDMVPPRAALESEAGVNTLWEHSTGCRRCLTQSSPAGVRHCVLCVVSCCALVQFIFHNLFLNTSISYVGALVLFIHMAGTENSFCVNLGTAFTSEVELS